MKKIKIIEKINIIFIIIVLLLIVIFFFINFFNNKNNEGELEVKKITSKFNYKLYENETDLYVLEFETLVDLLNEKNIDYEMYANTISKLFIIDFYTLSNKKSSYDVGGIQYIHKELKDNFILNVSNTVYKYISEKREELPTVKEISIVKTENIEYDYNKVKYSGYLVSLSWEYEEDLGYENKADLILIKDKEQLFIVEKKEL